MPSHRVHIDGYDNDSETGEYQPVSSFFTVEAANESEAITEATIAANDCGWDVEYAYYIEELT